MSSKRDTSSVHPLQGDELRALRRLQREQAPGPHVFVSERGAPMAPKNFHALIQRLGERAGMPFAIHPHMLRHGCDYELANKGHGYEGASGVARNGDILPTNN
jgi:integrase